MIPFAFTYCRPSSIYEAVALFVDLHAQGKQPLYYSGGTEILTLARLGQLQTGAVIDIKGIPECNVLEISPGQLTVGSAVTLNALSDSHLYPLLGQTCDEIADRTARNKITFGGNICGEIMYREAVLPLLLADSNVLIAGPMGVRRASIHQVFIERMRLGPGEFVVQAHIDPAFIQQSYYTVKKRRKGSVGYPVVTLAALTQHDGIRVAFSGICAFPFRSLAMEAVLNDLAIPVEVRVNRAMMQLPCRVLDDAEASAPYRWFVLHNTLIDAVHALEGVST